MKLHFVWIERTISEGLTLYTTQCNIVKTPVLLQKKQSPKIRNLESACPGLLTVILGTAFRYEFHQELS